MDSETTHSEDQGPATEQSASVIAPAPVLLDTHSLDVTMAESNLAFGDTMRLDDLRGGVVTPPQCATSIPIPAELANAIAEEIEQSPSTQLTSTCPIADDSATGAFRGHVISRVADTAAASDVTTTRTPDAHFQTLCATCIQKISDAASAAAVPDRKSNVTRIPQWYAAGPASTKV